VCKSVAEAADCAYSYVIITTKSIPDVVKTSTILAPFLSPEYTSQFPQPAYVFVQNGLNVEVDTYHAVKAIGQGEPRIISCAVYVLANLLAPNVVEHPALVIRSLSSSRPNLYPP
jgi:2-dehydropantoate 2-reductase